MINITPYKPSLFFVDLEDHDEQDGHYHEDHDDHDQSPTQHSDPDLEDYLDDDAGVGEKEEENGYIKVYLQLSTICALPN